MFCTPSLAVISVKTPWAAHLAGEGGWVDNLSWLKCQPFPDLGVAMPPHIDITLCVETGVSTDTELSGGIFYQ